MTYCRCCLLCSGVVRQDECGEPSAVAGERLPAGHGEEESPEGQAGKFGRQRTGGVIQSIQEEVNLSAEGALLDLLLYTGQSL